MPLGQKGIQKGGWFYPLLAFGKKVAPKTASATLKPEECGIITVAGTGAVTLTLPSPTNAKGLWFIILNLVGQNLTIAAPTADTLITFNDLAADSISFSTVAELIGAAALLVSDGTSWVAVALGPHTCTVTS